MKFIRKLGAGASADVWLCEDALGREVAVKIVRPSMAMYNDALTHARALARVSHPNVVQVFGLEKVVDPESQAEVDGVVMEYVNGRTLRSLLDAGAVLDVDVANRIGLGILDGVLAMHAAGVTHGDLHSENIMVGVGLVKVLDVFYDDSLAALSTMSRKERITRDVRAVRHIIEEVLGHLAFNQKAAVAFNTVGLSPSLPEIRAAFVQATAGKQHEVAEVAAPNESGRIFSLSLAAARSNDFLAWRRILAGALERYRQELSDIKAKVGDGVPRLRKDLPEWSRPFVEASQEMVAIALAGIESQAPRFQNQAQTLDELTIVPGWPGGGATHFVSLPELVGYCFQGLHGAFCVDRVWLDGAMNLAHARVNPVRRAESVAVYKSSHLVGWPASIDGDSKMAYDLLLEVAKAWPWLVEVFGGEERIESALCAYYMALNLLELADAVAGGQQLDKAPLGGLSYDVPLNFLRHSDAIRLKAYRILLQDPEQVRNIWHRMKVEDSDFAAAWPIWLRHMEAQISRWNYWGRGVPHKELLKDLGIER